MKFGWPISLILHGLFALAGLIVFSRSVAIDVESQIIPVELASISDITNIRASVRRPAVPTEKPEAPMTLENPMENAKEQGEINPVEKVAEISEPEIVIDDKGETEIEPEEVKPVKPEFDLDKFASIIDKTRESQPEANQQVTLKSEENFFVYAEKSQAGVGAANDLTLSQLDALKQKMYKCWRIPLDAKNPEELVVTVRVRMSLDGSVTDVRLHEPSKVANSANPFMPTAARRAVNAVTNCGPYDFLPADKYSSWKDMILRFIPEI